ncbi:MAG: HAD-IA family hydrolase [Spirochaetes bacterium]|nr:HAD-IA family hydrolase [Spirochaetota bacterium]
MIHGIIFDMDGVLADSEPIIMESAVQMFKEHGVIVQASDFLPFVGTGEARFLGGVAEKYGFTLDIERDKTRTYDIYLDIIRGRLKPIHGAVEFVRACKAGGKRIAIATSADSRKMNGNLNEIGLPPSMFDAVVTGNDVVNKKPAPDIFLAAAKRLGIPAADCLVVEDAPNGIIAAKSAGAQCLGITSTFAKEVLIQAGADHTAASLADVPGAIMQFII